MALSEFEIAQIEKAMADFMKKRRPPVHIRKDLDIIWRFEGQSGMVISQSRNASR